MYMKTIELFPETDAYVDFYLHDAQISWQLEKKRPIVVICPGGAYVNLAKKEADPVAFAFLNQGYHVAVVRYRTFLKNRETENPRAHFLGAVHDLMEVMHLIHIYHEAWSIKDKEVILCGFSAGGHLAGYLSEHWDDEQMLSKYYPQVPADIFKPKAVLLSYPPTDFSYQTVQENGLTPEIHRQLFQMISELPLSALNLSEHVRPDMPSVFLWQTSEDTLVPIQATVTFYQELLAKKVPCEAHFYQRGIHGVGLATQSYAKYAQDDSPHLQSWFGLACQWLEEQLLEKERGY